MVRGELLDLERGKIMGEWDLHGRDWNAYGDNEDLLREAAIAYDSDDPLAELVMEEIGIGY